MKNSNKCAKAVAAASAAAFAVSGMSFGASADSVFSSSKLLNSGASAVEDILENGTGYKGKLTVSPTADLSESLGLKTELKDIALDFDMSVQDQLVGLNGTLTYGDGNLGSVEVVADRDTNRIYLRIPELSDDYLYVNVDDIEIDGEDSDIEIDDETVSEITSEIDWSDLDLSALESLNPAAVIGSIQNGLKALGSYVNSASELLGNPTQTAVITSSIEDVEYKYLAVTYSLNYTQMNQLAGALSEAAKDDENVIALAKMLGYDAENDGNIVKAMIEDYIWEGLDDESAQNATYTITLYTSDSELGGIDFDNGTIFKRLITTTRDNSTAYDYMTQYKEDGDEVTDWTGVAVTANTDGSFSGKSEEKIRYRDLETDEEYLSNTVTTFDNIVIGDNQIKGSITIDSYDDGELTQTDKLTLDVTGDKQSVEYKSYEGETLLVTITYEGEKTEAKAVSVPTGKLYNALDEDELNEYLENADLDGFEDNARNVLGDELYELLFSDGEEDENNSSNDSDPDNTESNPTTSSYDAIITETQSSSADSSSASSSAGSSAQSSSASGTSDSSPNTGTAAVGFAAVLIAAGAVAVNKRK